MKQIILICVTMFLYQKAYSQQSISGIKVLVKNNATDFPFINDTLLFTINDSIKVNMPTDQQGYNFIYLKPGKYSIAAEHKGYYKYEFRGINLREDQTTYITIGLSPIDIKTKGVRLKKVKTK